MTRVNKVLCKAIATDVFRRRLNSIGHYFLNLLLKHAIQSILTLYVVWNLNWNHALYSFPIAMNSVGHLTVQANTYCLQ